MFDMHFTLLKNKMLHFGVLYLPAKLNHQNIGFFFNDKIFPISLYFCLIKHAVNLLLSVSFYRLVQTVRHKSGVASSIPTWSHIFVEIDHKIIYSVILLPSAESFKKGCCQLQAKECAQSTGYLLVQACPGKSG